MNLTEVATSTPPETPTRRALAPLALALLQGTLVGLGFFAAQSVLCGQDYVPLVGWGGLAVGLALTPLGDRFGPRAAQGAGALLGLTLAALLLLGWSAAAASALGLAAGALFATEARGGSALAALTGAATGTLAAGHLAPSWATGASALPACLALGAAAVIRLRPPGGDSPSGDPPNGDSPSGTRLTAHAVLPALRLASLWVLSAGALRFVTGGWPEAAALAAAPLLGGLLLSLALGSRLPRSPALTLGAELLGWGGVWLVAQGVPDAVRGQGAPASLWALLVASGLLAAPAWARSRGTPAAASLSRQALLASALACTLLGASPLGTWIFHVSLAHASDAQRAALGWGQGQVANQEFADAVAAGRISARVWSQRRLWPSTTCVLEAKRDARRLRLLSQAGEVRSALPDRRGAEAHPEAPAVVAGALAAWNADALAGAPLLQVGLGDGVLAATLSQRQPPPAIYESDPSLLSLHTHAARPFAFRVGDVAEFAGRLHVAPPSARPPTSLVVYALAPKALPEGEFTVPLSVLPGTWLGGLAERSCWAFVVGEGLVLTTRLPSLAELEAGWKREPGLTKSLADVGLRRPLELLSCLAANPSGLSALAADHPSGKKDLHASEVLRVGARTLASGGPDLGAGPPAAAAGAALAELLARRESPAALPFAKAAVASLRSSTTLRTLGDVLHLEAARAKRAPSQDPVPLWAEALELDPRDVGARLALGWHHYDRKDFKAAQRLLLPGVGRDAQRERELQYLLGLSAFGLQEAGPARLHFQAARGFRNADDLAALARSMAQAQRKQRATQTTTPPEPDSPAPDTPAPDTPAPDTGDPGPRETQGPPSTPSPPATLPQARNRIRAAELFWRQAQAQSGDAQLGALLNAADTLTRAASGRAQLAPKEQLKLARLLRKVGEELAARRGVALQARALARVEAEVWAPLTPGAPRRAIDRVKALARGGQGEQALSELEALVAGAGARLPFVHVALAELHLRAQRNGLAIQAYHQALAVSPNTSGTAKIYMALAGAYVIDGRTDRAQSVLEAAARLYPSHPKIMLALAEIYVQLGLTGDARRTLKAFLDSAPETHPDRAKAKTALEGL